MPVAISPDGRPTAERAPSVGWPGGTRVLVRLAGLVVLVGTLAGSIGAVTTVVGFEEFDDGTELTTQYESLGVSFEVQEGESAGAIVETCDAEGADCTSAWEDRNVVVTPVDFEFTREPLVAVFVEPQDEVSLYVREATGVEGTQTAQLVARDAAGGNVARTAVEFDAGTGWRRIAVSTQSASISEVVLTLADSQNRQQPHNRFVADDLTFQVNEPPTAAFVHTPDNPTIGGSVTFDASDSFDPDGEIVEFRWDFDGNGSIDRITRAPSVTNEFAEPGIYPVTLEIVDDDGSTDSVSEEVTVGGDPIARCAVSDTTVEPGEQILIDASDSKAELVRFDVDGDGDLDRVNDDDFREVVSYVDAGDETPMVRAEIGQRSESRQCPTISVIRPPGGGLPGSDAAIGGAGGLFGVWVLRGVYRRVQETRDGENRPPIANLEYAPSEPAPGGPVVFDGSRSTDPDPDDRIVTYRWTVEDRVESVTRFTHAFREAGEYDVALEVTDGRGATGSETETITVEAGEGELILDGIHPDAPGDDHENLDEEYLVFENAGDVVLELDGWTVHDAAEEEDRVTAGEHTFEFPDGFALDPGATVTIHTGTGPETGTAFEDADGGRHLFWGKRRAVWNNDEDVVVVEDDVDHPVVAIRYARNESGEYDVEGLDVELLGDWFPDVGVSRQDGSVLDRIASGIREAISRVPGFVAGAVFLRDPRTYLRNWALVMGFLLAAWLTWGASTSAGLVSPSFEPIVPLLLGTIAVLMLVVGVVWLTVSVTVSTLRKWLA